MSQAHVDQVRAFGDHWTIGDLEAIRESYDPDIVVWTDEKWPEPRPYGA
jgi:hypothetical protein